MHSNILDTTNKTALQSSQDDTLKGYQLANQTPSITRTITDWKTYFRYIPKRKICAGYSCAPKRIYLWRVCEKWTLNWSATWRSIASSFLKKAWHFREGNRSFPIFRVYCTIAHAMSRIGSPTYLHVCTRETPRNCRQMYICDICHCIIFHSPCIVYTRVTPRV